MEGALPTDQELLAFARSLIGDTSPFLDTAGLEVAIAENRELWVKLFRVDAGLSELELDASPNDSPPSTSD